MGSPCKNCGKWKDAIPRPPPPPQLSFAVSGVYKSTDSAASWKPMDTGAVSKLEVHSLAVSANDIFAGTENGVWCQSLTATEPADNKNDCF